MSRAIHPRTAMAGMSLVEMMIALVLGLLVVAAATGIYLSNRQTYRATQNLGVVQENVRTAFELMARDLREAAGNPCINNLPIANVINNSASRWWTQLTLWDTGIEGFGPQTPFPGATFGTDAGVRLAGTDAVQIFTADDSVATISAHSSSSGQFTLNTARAGFKANDVVMVCNSNQAALFQASAVNGATVTLGTGGSLGNCSTNLSIIDPAQACSERKPIVFPPNSVMAKLNATRWYIANNANGQRALYQSRLLAGNAVAEEVAEGISNISMTYLLRGGGTDYISAANVAGRWADVISVRVDLTVVSPERVGTDNAPLQRQLVHVVSLRNRNR